MASLRQIRRRMRSIENIHEITKAMEMIAAFRFKRAETRFSKSKNFVMEMEKLAANLSRSVRDLSDPRHQGVGGQALFETRKVRKKTLVVMTGDKGLCGAYNTNLLRSTMQWLRDNKAFETSVVPVGKVGCEALKKRQAAFLGSYPEKGAADRALARRMTEDLKSLFLSGRTDSVELLYTSFRAGGSGQIRFAPFLSLDYLLKRAADPTAEIEYIYEPDLNAVFTALVSRFIEGKIYLALLESLTSEYSARMTAMKQATENGEEVLDSLRLLRNKTRQATITRELSEIVAGASILV